MSFMYPFNWFFPGDQDDGSDDHYLHPSLAPGSSRVELVG